MRPCFFALIIFQTGSFVYAQANWALDPSIYASCVTGMLGAHLFIG
jgi:hypothetical protein